MIGRVRQTVVGPPRVLLSFTGLAFAGLAGCLLGLSGCEPAVDSSEGAAATSSAAPSPTTAGAGARLEGLETRRFSFDYEVEIPEREPGSGSMQVFLPIALETPAQRILDLEIDSPFEGRIETEPVYGNRFWHAQVPAEAPATTIRIAYQVERRVRRGGDEPGDHEHASRFLEANDRVVVGHPVLEPILAEIRAASPGAGPSERARAIFDWVVDNIEYKKVGTGWGNGDTFWACSERYGNCTDFHSLFISLARTEGIPARFEMGFPIPTDREAGEIAGYHCWVEFWLPEEGWIPIDASEAFKQPDRRELFYGTHPADRLHLTTGRDLRLGPAHQDRGLNYFVYPYIEIDGRRSDAPIRTRFSYRDSQPGVATAG